MDFEPCLIEPADLMQTASLFGSDDQTCDLANLKDQVRHAQAMKSKSRIRTRRAKSEAALAEVLPPVIEVGDSWHVISQGDIDSLSFLAHIVEYEPLDYLLLSTWCMAGEDVSRLERWIAEGRIGRLDCYVGEIFPNQYTDVHIMLCAAAKKTGGRVCVFRNHSKVYARANSRLQFAIESSANINTNPRCEQTAIHADAALFEFYKEFFDGIHSFTRDFDNWTPYAWTRPETDRPEAGRR